MTAYVTNICITIQIQIPHVGTRTFNSMTDTPVKRESDTPVPVITTAVIKRESQQIPHAGTRIFNSMEEVKEFFQVGKHWVHSSPCVDTTKLNADCPLTYEEWQLHPNPRTSGCPLTTWVCRRRRKPPTPKSKSTAPNPPAPVENEVSDLKKRRKRKKKNENEKHLKNALDTSGLNVRRDANYLSSRTAGLWQNSQAFTIMTYNLFTNKIL